MGLCESHKVGVWGERSNAVSELNVVRRHCGDSEDCGDVEFRGRSGPSINVVMEKDGWMLDDSERENQEV
jgi:hypothetical protein